MEKFLQNDFLLWCVIVVVMMVSVAVVYKSFKDKFDNRDRIIKSNFDYANQCLSFGYCMQCDCLMNDEREEIILNLKEIYDDVFWFERSGNTYIGRRCFQDFKVHP